MLKANIQNFSYTKMWLKSLKSFDFTDINALPSKWISPKRNAKFKNYKLSLRRKYDKSAQPTA